MKINGTVDQQGNCSVFVNGRPLKATDAALRSSPTGFNWGYAGSGAYALAHSLLARVKGRKIADIHAPKFKAEIVVNIEHGKPFEMDSREILDWLGW